VSWPGSQLFVIPTEGRNLLLEPRSPLLRLHHGQQKPRDLRRSHGLSDVAGALAQSCAVEGFTKRYNVTRLVYYEVFQYVNNAIARETEIKKWRREKKVAVIERSNPTWEDLAADWGTSIPPMNADSSLRSE
jgi:hypothetical protein